ncbi:SUPPRESSOR OF GAMMA RESPONSE 1-like isoform X1 [Fagus crenata]
MARAWLINSRGLARKVRNATCSPAYQIKDCGANRECPNCHYRIDNSDVSPEWPGLPVGVKFEPSDAELLEHLAAKCGVGNSKPHLFIDEFIQTLEGDKGICYSHPKDLPGAKKDGSSVHFFHRTINAYASGQRKRRKIHSEHNLTEGPVRWHKTGKTKPVMENGVQKRCKKIMVLYKSSKKGTKPDKSNWVMHQYHLGTEENEKEGEFVVSRILYQQQKQSEINDDNLVVEDSDVKTLRTSPRTPNANPPNPPRPGKSVHSDDVGDNNVLLPSLQEVEFASEESHAPPLDFQTEDNMDYPAWLAGESQAVENSGLNSIDDSLLCKEIFESCAPLNNSGLNYSSYTGLASNTNEMTANNNASSGFADLENLELDTPPDFHLSDLQFGSQESIFSWIDRIFFDCNDLTSLLQGHWSLPVSSGACFLNSARLQGTPDHGVGRTFQLSSTRDQAWELIPWSG